MLLDLLTEREEQRDLVTAEHRFDIGLLTSRLVAAIDWLAARPDTGRLPVGLFGASTGAAAALRAARSGRRRCRPSSPGAAGRTWPVTALSAGSRHPCC